MSSSDKTKISSELMGNKCCISSTKNLKLSTRQIYSLFNQQKAEEAFYLFDELIDNAERNFGEYNALTLTLKNNKAMKMAELKMPEGLSNLKALLPIFIQVWGDTDTHTLSLKSNIAAATGMLGMYCEAVNQIESILKIGGLTRELVETLEVNLQSWNKALNR